jgi:hypothetical protein
MRHSDQKRTARAPNGAERDEAETMAKQLAGRLVFRLPTLAKAFDLSPHYLRKEIRGGRLRAYKAGSVWIISADDARAWLIGLPTNQPEGAREAAEAAARGPFPTPETLAWLQAMPQTVFANGKKGSTD